MRLGLVPNRIAVQLALLLVVSVLVATVPGGLIGYFLGPGGPRDEGPKQAGNFFAVARLLAAEPDEAARLAVIGAARVAMPGLDLTLDRRPADPAAPHATAASLGSGAPSPSGPPGSSGSPEGFARFVARELPGTTVAVEAPAPLPGAPKGPAEAARVAVTFADGAVLRATLASAPPRPFFLFGPLFGAFLFVLVGTVLLSIWAALRLTGPLRRFAAAAQDFELGSAHEPLPDQGPEEIRAAARALNALRDRVNDLVGRQSRMLAAVGHDLRTPITRLRLRTEFIDDAPLRRAFEADLDRMSAMVERTLTFLRTGETATRREPIDLGALLHTIVDEFAELGGSVDCEAAPQILVCGDEDTLRRAFSNLIENGLKFGSGVAVRLRDLEGRAIVEIEDDGPGIPAAERERMLEPFVRGDAARSATAGDGFGLGLAIATAIVAGHGGRLELADAVPHGLRVRVDLPKAR